MVRRPPRPTLFPYTRSSDLRRNPAVAALLLAAVLLLGTTVAATTWALKAAAEARQNQRPRWRSEEHTSELQSRVDLGCRLLLHKTTSPGAQPNTATRIEWTD